MSDKETHDSWGLIQINRVSGSRQLFRSPLNHQAYIEISISRASIGGFRGDKFLRNGGELLRVQMSAVQFAEALTQMGMMPGVPCTISRLNGVYIPEPPPEEDDIQQAVEESVGEGHTFERARVLVNEALAVLHYESTRNGSPRKSQIELVSEYLRELKTRISIDLPFWRNELVERAHVLRAKVKSEMVATADLILRQIGVESLREKVKLLPTMSEPYIPIQERMLNEMVEDEEKK